MINFYLKLFCKVLFVVLLISCKSEICDCEINEEVLAENINSIKKAEESNFWKKAGLKDYKTFENDIYKLTIIPSWDNSKVSEFILENDKNSPTLYKNIYSKTTSLEQIQLKQIGKTEKINLTKQQWSQFDIFIKNMCFYTMPPLEKGKYLDGVSWVLEVSKKTKNVCSNQTYYVVQRVANSPEYFELCDKLLKLANSSKKEQDNLLHQDWTSE